MFIFSLPLGRITTSEMPVTTITVTGTTDASGNHCHAIISPAYKADDGNGLGRGYNWDHKQTYYTEYDGTHTHTFTGKGTIGGGDSHNNLPPYTVVYRWRRVA